MSIVSIIKEILAFVGGVSTIYFGYRAVKHIFIDEAIKTRMAEIHRGNLAVSAAAKLAVFKQKNFENLSFWNHIDLIIQHESSIAELLEVALKNNASREVATLIAAYQSIFKELNLSNQYIDLSLKSSKIQIGNIDDRLINRLFENLLYLLIDFSSNGVITVKRPRLMPLFQIRKRLKKIVHQPKIDYIPALSSDAYRSMDIILRLLTYPLIEGVAPHYFCTVHKSFFKYEGCNDILLIYLFTEKIYMPLVLEYGDRIPQLESASFKLYLIRFHIGSKSESIDFYYSDLDSKFQFDFNKINLDMCKDVYLNRRTKLFAGTTIYTDIDKRIIKMTLPKSKLESAFKILRPQLKKKLRILKASGRPCINYPI